MNPIKVVDLFAGPGGLGEGFSSVKDGNGDFVFKLVVSVEKDKSAHQTLTLRAFIREFPGRQPPKEYYSFLRREISESELFDLYPSEYSCAAQETLNRPRELGVEADDRAVHEAIKKSIGNDRNWILIGGPPCQAYSLVGRARNIGTKGYKAENDHRHFLYREYLEILNKFRPAAFVMENVKGMLSSRVDGQPIFDQILNDLRKSGYKLHSLSTAPIAEDLHDGPHYKSNRDFVIKAELYGVPQNRHRVILLGIRNDLDIESNGILLEKVRKTTVREMIADFPRLRSGISKEQDSTSNWKSIIRESHSRLYEEEKSENWPPVSTRGTSFMESYHVGDSLPKKLRDFVQDKKLKGFLNHETRSHIRADLARYYFASSYAKNRKISPRLTEFPEWLQPKHANRKSGKFVDRFKVQVGGQPASTVTSHISKDGHYFIHYDPLQCRSLTVREAARVQTFPDNYLFCGNRTQQYVQVGNAVPPYLAKQIADIISSIMSYQ